MFTPAFTGKSLFPVNIDRHSTGWEVQGAGSKVLAVDEFIDWMELLRKEVEMALEKTNETMKKQFDIKRGEKQHFKIGGLVWIDMA